MNDPGDGLELDGEVIVQTPAGWFALRGASPGVVLLSCEKVGVLWHLYRRRHTLQSLINKWPESRIGDCPRIWVLLKTRPLLLRLPSGVLRPTLRSFFLNRRV